MSLNTLSRWLPFLNWPRPEPALLKGEFWAGMTVGLMLVPQGVAYAALAGMPLVTGIYASLVPALVAVLFSASTRLGVGPTALTSLLIGASLTGLAEPGSAQWVAMAAWMAILSGLLQLVMGLARFGWLLNLVTSPVLSGFTQAAALLILSSQLGALTGLRSDLGALWTTPSLGHFDLTAAAFGLGSLVLLIVARRLRPGFPAAIVVLGAAGAVSWALGYAEADPTFDIEGVDAAHKATIMSAIAFGIPVQFDKAYVEGITKLGAADIKYAEQLGYRIKLLGITKRAEKGIELRVHPSLVPSKRLIANVEGAMNAVVVQGDAVGTTLYYGKGAGSEPTASAVIADLVDIARLHTADPEHRVPHLAFQPHTLTDAMGALPVLPMSEVVTSYYLRLRVADQAGVLAKVTGLLAEAGVSIDAVLQREADEVGGEGSTQTDLIILTHDTREGTMDAVIAQMQALPTVLAPITRIRKEELN